MYGCYGGYGNTPGGYGDFSRESDADFEELIIRSGALERRPGERTLDRRVSASYDVYGVATSLAEDRMTRRVMQAEEMKRRLLLHQYPGEKLRQQRQRWHEDGQTELAGEVPSHDSVLQEYPQRDNPRAGNQQQ